MELKLCCLLLCLFVLLWSRDSVSMTTGGGGILRRRRHYRHSSYGVSTRHLFCHVAFRDRYFPDNARFWQNFVASFFSQKIYSPISKNSSSLIHFSVFSQTSFCYFSENNLIYAFEHTQESEKRINFS